MIVQKYLLREITRSQFLVLTLLLVIYVGHRFGRYLAQASSGQVPPQLLLDLTALKVLENLPVLLPLAFFLAVLTALGRLARDSELVALHAGGISSGQVVRTVLAAATGVGLLVAACSLYLAPIMVSLQEELLRTALGQTPIAGLQPGRFREFADGRRVVYVRDVDVDGVGLLEVFVRAERAGTEDVLVAERATASVEGTRGERYMLLRDGHRFTGLPGRRDYVVTRFGEHAIRIEQVADDGAYRKLREVPTAALLAAPEGEYAGELLWRLSMPVTVVLLALMAVPLARSSPRAGRYAQVFLAVLIYLLYNNAIGIGQNLLERGVLGWWLAALPVHAAMLFAALLVGWLRSPVRPRLSEALRPWRRRSRARRSAGAARSPGTAPARVRVP